MSTPFSSTLGHRRVLFAETDHHNAMDSHRVHLTVSFSELYYSYAALRSLMLLLRPLLLRFAIGYFNNEGSFDVTKKQKGLF